MGTQRDDRRRSVPSAQCSLCGIALPAGLLVADGGQACADIRWYCQDTQSCTERWTTNLPRHPLVAPTPSSLAAQMTSSAPASPARPGGRPAPVRAERRGAPAAEAWSIDPS